MPPRQWHARQRGPTVAKTKAPVELTSLADLGETALFEHTKDLTSPALLAELEQACITVRAGEKARGERDALLKVLLNRPRADASIEDLMEITGYQRAMVYRYRATEDAAIG